jgi:hypothetical protein
MLPPFPRQAPGAAPRQNTIGAEAAAIHSQKQINIFIVSPASVSHASADQRPMARATETPAADRRRFAAQFSDFGYHFPDRF